MKKGNQVVQGERGRTEQFLAAAGSGLSLPTPGMRAQHWHQVCLGAPNPNFSHVGGCACGVKLWHGSEAFGKRGSGHEVAGRASMGGCHCGNRVDILRSERYYIVNFVFMRSESLPRSR